MTHSPIFASIEARMNEKDAEIKRLTECLSAMADEKPGDCPTGTWFIIKAREALGRGKADNAVVGIQNELNQQNSPRVRGGALRRF